MDKSKVAARGCITFLFTLILSPAYYILWGWILQTLWGWFVVPQFVIAPLPLPIAVGLIVITRFLQTPDTRKTEERDKIADDGEYFNRLIADWVAWNVVYPLIALGIGWIVTQFI